MEHIILKLKKRIKKYYSEQDPIEAKNFKSKIRNFKSSKRIM